MARYYNIPPTFKVGDYLKPIRKSIFCDFSEPSLVLKVDEIKELYTIRTKQGDIKLSFAMQELYQVIIPNRKQTL